MFTNFRRNFAPTTRPANGPETVTEVACKNGKHIHVRWSNTAILDAGSKTQSILAVGVDISDLIDAQQQALQAQRLAAIGQTMTGLAHESRNALQRIMAATDMLEHRVGARRRRVRPRLCSSPLQRLGA